MHDVVADRCMYYVAESIRITFIDIHFWNYTYTYG